MLPKVLTLKKCPLIAMSRYTRDPLMNQPIGATSVDCSCICVSDVKHENTIANKLCINFTTNLEFVTNFSTEM